MTGHGQDGSLGSHHDGPLHCVSDAGLGLERVNWLHRICSTTNTGLISHLFNPRDAMNLIRHCKSHFKVVESSGMRFVSRKKEDHGHDGTAL